MRELVSEKMMRGTLFCEVPKSRECLSIDKRCYSLSLSFYYMELLITSDYNNMDTASSCCCMALLLVDIDKQTHNSFRANNTIEIWKEVDSLVCCSILCCRAAAAGTS